MSKRIIKLTAFAVMCVFGSLPALAYYDVNHPEKSGDIFCEEFGYCFRPPLTSKATIGNNNIQAFGNWGSDEETLYNIQPYHLSSTPCTVFKHGITACGQPEDFEEGYKDTGEVCNELTVGTDTPAIWGRADYHYDGRYMHDMHYIKNRVDVLCGSEDSLNDFAFCSQKDDKTVIICLTQNTDNPEMAKEIFESFKWADPSDAFSDVSVTHSYADAISYVRNENIVSGYPDGTYRPDNPINRAEFTKIIVNAALDASLLTKNQECFPDVTTTDWFAPFVCTAKEQGIISGYPDGEFKASGNINAAEAFKIVAEAFGMALPETGEKDQWYQRYWTTMQDHEAIPATITKPDQLLTRGEMAETIYRVMNSNER